jgi:4-hydroxy-4-methyl-2-oxoglutarate aldolase
MADMTTKVLIDKLARLDTSVMSDVLDEARLQNQTLSSDFRPLDARIKLAGVALCARGRQMIRGAHKTASNAVSSYEIERRMSPGMVLVLDAGSEHVAATVGGFVAATLQAKGCRGLVVNGAIRDAIELQEFQLPTFYRFHSPLNAGRRWELIDLEEPVAMPGIDGIPVLVNPGDLVLGDIDGIVIIPFRHAKQLIEAAEKLQEIERIIRDEIKAGATREEAFARNPRFSHISPIPR